MRFIVGIISGAGLLHRETRQHPPRTLGKKHGMRKKAERAESGCRVRRAESGERVRRTLRRTAKDACEKDVCFSQSMALMRRPGSAPQHPHTESLGTLVSPLCALPCVPDAAPKHLRSVTTLSVTPYDACCVALLISAFPAPDRTQGGRGSHLRRR